MQPIPLENGEDGHGLDMGSPGNPPRLLLGHVENGPVAPYMKSMRDFPSFDRFRLHGSSLMSRLLPSERFAR